MVLDVTPSTSWRPATSWHRRDEIALFDDHTSVDGITLRERAREVLRPRSVDQLLHGRPVPVYCDRIATVSNHAPVDTRVMLGRVIAHEIGHLLLPPNGHSPVGIMRPQIDLSREEFNGFTGGQIDAMRRALEAAHAAE